MAKMARKIDGENGENLWRNFFGHFSHFAMAKIEKKNKWRMAMSPIYGHNTSSLQSYGKKTYSFSWSWTAKCRLAGRHDFILWGGAAGLWHPIREWAAAWIWTQVPAGSNFQRRTMKCHRPMKVFGNKKWIGKRIKFKVQTRVNQQVMSVNVNHVQHSINLVPVTIYIILRYLSFNSFSLFHTPSSTVISFWGSWVFPRGPDPLWPHPLWAWRQRQGF